MVRFIVMLTFYLSFTAMVAIGESKEESATVEVYPGWSESRAYENAPPLIPHDIEGYRITRFENACLDCHLDFYEVPSSHFLNEHTNQQKYEQVAGIRYNCIQCHLPKSSPGIKKEIDIRDPRPYKDAPPTIPHLLIDIEISKDHNSCMVCHMDDEKIKPSPSHFINEFTGGQNQEQVVGTRYNCLQCHLPNAKIQNIKRIKVENDYNNTCIRCHAILPDKRLSEPVALWARSVHAEVGNTCDGCHGGDPSNHTGKSMSKEKDFQPAPSKKEIASFCGKCHQEIADNYMISPHWKKKAQSCIDCHGSHTIKRVSSEIVNEVKCGKCHAYDIADKYISTLQSLHDSIKASEEQAKLIVGFPTETIDEDINRVWKRSRQLRMISHATDFKLMEIETEKVQALLRTTNNEINRLLSLGEERRLLGYGLIATFLFLALITYFYNKKRE